MPRSRRPRTVRSTRGGTSRKPKPDTLAALLAAPLGPLTVRKARALAGPPVRQKALERRAVIAAHREAGAARRNLAARYREEIDERIRHYDATYALLRAHGVAGAQALGAARVTAPLRIVAEGDSWFNYPLHFGGGVIPRLEDAIGVPILNLAKAGDETRYMLGVEEREELEEVLGDAVSKQEPFDALLFSGGGNDIVGDPMCLWIKTWDPAQPPAWHLDAARFKNILGCVQSAYEDLFAIRDRLSPNTHIFLHGYDFALPTGKGVCFLGPWLEPSLDHRKFPSFPSQADRFELVKEMLLQFQALLTRLATNRNVTLIPTQGTLTDEQWSNELHPTRDGFNAVTEVFRLALRTVYPGRVR